MPDSVFSQCLSAVKTTIDGLSLSGSPTVTVRKHSVDDRQVFHGITLSPEPVRSGQGTNADDDNGYGILVTMALASAQGYTENLEKLNLWTQSIRNAFSGKRLSGVTEVYVCWCEADRNFDDRKYADDYDFSTFIIRCWSRELVRS